MSMLFGSIKPNKFCAIYKKNIVNIQPKNATVKNTKVFVFCIVLFFTERLLIPSRDLFRSRRDTYGVTCLKPDFVLLYKIPVEIIREFPISYSRLCIKSLLTILGSVRKEGMSMMIFSCQCSQMKFLIAYNEISISL